MKIRGRWRRFRSMRPVTVQPVFVHDDEQLIVAAEARVHELIAGLRVRRFRGFDATRLHPIIATFRHDNQAALTSLDLLILLLLQAPGAVQAQRQMDKHPHGYQNHKARLLELIDFNDSYVSFVLSLPDNLLSELNEEVKLAIDRLCKRLSTPSFSNEQWEAITYGLSREIAVYRGAIKEGLRAEMTSRTQDAMGVDMVITDESGRSINIDVKTRSSFHFRIKDLMREGRVSAAKGALAEEQGYCPVTNGHGPDHVDVVLLRIDRESLGEIVEFAFENAHLLGTQLRLIIDQFGVPPKARYTK